MKRTRQVVLIVLLSMLFAALLGVCIKGTIDIQSRTVQDNFIINSYSTGDMNFKYIIVDAENNDTLFNYLVDMDTGVIYLEYSSGHRYGLTPLYNADGSLKTLETLGITNIQKEGD